MRPITVLNGIVLGTTAAIAISLGVVLLIFFLLQGESPQLAEEIGPLTRFTILFWLAAIGSAGSFYGHITEARWRWWGQLGGFLTVAIVVLYAVADLRS